jgi:hypothetical protein
MGASSLLRALLLILLLPLLATACANGDFGRIKPWLVRDDIHDWVGAHAATSAGVYPSTYPLTEDERLLRNLGFQLIEPAYDRNRWYSILNEYGLSRVVLRDWCFFNITEYDSYLKATPFRSATARYARLNEAVRNDVERIPAFTSAARRVLDMDARRAKTVEQTAVVSPAEAANANARIAENGLVIAWVQQSLVNRAATYAYALERLAIATPTPMAAEVDRSITLLKTTAADNRIIPGPELEPGAIVLVAPYPLFPPPPPGRGARVAQAPPPQ